MTPTMEDVAGWLREAADAAYDVNEGRPLDDGWFELFNDRAAQVEAMGTPKTCDTCRWWGDKPIMLFSSQHKCLLPDNYTVSESQPKFGCIHHKNMPNHR